MLPANNRRPSRCPPSPREAEQTTERGRGTPRQAACNPSPSAAHGIIYSSRIQLRGVAQTPPPPPPKGRGVRGGVHAAAATAGGVFSTPSWPRSCLPPGQPAVGGTRGGPVTPATPNGGEATPRRARAPPNAGGVKRRPRTCPPPPQGGPSGGLQGRLHLPHDFITPDFYSVSRA